MKKTSHTQAKQK